MNDPLLILAQALSQAPTYPGLRLTFPWDWDVRPPCLALALTHRQPIVSVANGPTKSWVQLQVWHTDGFAAVRLSHQLVDLAEALRDVRTDDGVLRRACLSDGPHTVSTDETAAADSKLVRSITTLTAFTTDD